MSYAEQLQSIVGKYRKAGKSWPATAREIAAWAIRRGLWRPQSSSLVNRCTQELAQAMREEYVVDRQGRTVRAKHAARIRRDGEQITLWADIRTAGRKHMEIAFQQRRQIIVGECRQLKADVDSYNDNASRSDPIQMIFDFTFDLEESEAA